MTALQNAQRGVRGSPLVWHPLSGGRALLLPQQRGAQPGLPATGRFANLCPFGKARIGNERGRHV